jgi:cell division GTPase FtsZ
MKRKRSAKPLPEIFISKEVVNERVQNFISGKHALLSTAMGKPETRAAWYSLQQFEQLMREFYYLNADGLRIYFGAYPKDDLQYPDHLTVIFVPTYLDEETGKQKDIIIDDDDEYTTRAASKSFKFDIPKNLDSIGLCPPGCDGDGGGDLSYPNDTK